MSSASEKFGIVVVGPGLIGSTHIKIIKQRTDCRLIAIVGPNTGPNLEHARLSEVPLMPDLAELFSIMRPDAVIISSPNEFHFRQAMLCVEKGVPVLVEKPLAPVLSDAKRLVDMSEVTGVPILVGHHRTYSSLLDAANSFLKSPEFGEMVALSASALFYKPAQYFLDGPWRTVEGGGPVLINLIHEIGLMRHFAGEILSVFALATNNIRKYEVEDSAAICIHFANGAVGTFVLSDTAASSKSWEMTSGENEIYPHYPQESCWHFAGTRGSLDFPSMRAWTYPEPVGPSWRNPFAVRTIPLGRRDPLEAQMEHFVEVIRGRAKPKVSAEDGYRNLLVIEAIKRSIATGTIVAISDIARGVEN